MGIVLWCILCSVYWIKKRKKYLHIYGEEAIIIEDFKIRRGLSHSRSNPFGNQDVVIGKVLLNGEQFLSFSPSENIEKLKRNQTVVIRESSGFLDGELSFYVEPVS